MGSNHSALMKHDKYVSNRNSKLSDASPSVAVAEAKTGNTNLAPTHAAVARRAYFAYVNEGSRPGRDLKHWLEAEMQLHAEIIRGNGHHAGS